MKILKLIEASQEIKVSKLQDKINLDRGSIEGAVATLVDKSLITKTVIKRTIYSLTTRGNNALNGLPERLIIVSALENELSMKDVSDKTGLSKPDVSAGIGFLRKSGVILIEKGLIKIINSQSAKTFSVSLQNALEAVADGKNSIDPSLITTLASRGFIEVTELSEAKVKLKITKSQLTKIRVIDEISKLSPNMIASGSWKNVKFKPYSMITRPRMLYAGRYNPYRNFVDHLKQKLVGLGFQEMKGPLLEQEFWNFDALFAPQDHSSREDTDILLVKKPTHGKLATEQFIDNVAKTHEDGWTTGSKGHRYKWDPKKSARLLLRPQGTAISARTLGSVKKPPAKFFSIARCFRPDQVDATHDVEFDQTEGIILGKDITFRDLLGMLKTFAVEVAGATDVRFRPDYYPFTSPSVELSAKHPDLGYIEFGGAGIFRPEVTQPFGIDYPVLAWGLGVGRLFMTKYNITDIRELFSQNLDWLRDAEVSAGIQITKEI